MAETSPHSVWKRALGLLADAPALSVPLAAMVYNDHEPWLDEGGRRRAKYALLGACPHGTTAAALVGAIAQDRARRASATVWIAPYLDALDKAVTAGELPRIWATHRLQWQGDGADARQRRELAWTRLKDCARRLQVRGDVGAHLKAAIARYSERQLQNPEGGADPWSLRPSDTTTPAQAMGSPSPSSAPVAGTAPPGAPTAAVLPPAAPTEPRAPAAPAAPPFDLAAFRAQVAALTDAAGALRLALGTRRADAWVVLTEALPKLSPTLPDRAAAHRWLVAQVRACERERLGPWAEILVPPLVDASQLAALGIEVEAKKPYAAPAVVDDAPLTGTEAAPCHGAPEEPDRGPPRWGEDGEESLPLGAPANDDAPPLTPAPDALQAAVDRVAAVRNLPQACKRFAAELAALPPALHTAFWDGVTSHLAARFTKRAFELCPAQKDGDAGTAVRTLLALQVAATAPRARAGA